MRRNLFYVRVLPLLSLLLALVMPLAGYAATATPSPRGPTPTPNEVAAVAKELWCPLCNGVRLDNCDLQACIQMREVISQKLAEGASTDQIKAYFVQQYGDVVLGVPANEGFSRIAWILPVAVAVLALGWLAYFVSMLVRRRRQPTLAAGARPTGKPTAKDDLLKRVDEELKRYE